jgi:hypothetical protein
MLKQIRGKRFDMKTTVIALVVIGIFWSIVSWMHVETAIPPELTELPGDTVLPRAGTSLVTPGDTL